MTRPTQNADLNADVTEVLADIREAIGEDDEPRVSGTLDGDIDADQRPTGTHHRYVHRDWEANNDADQPAVLARALVYADTFVTPEPRPPTSRTSRPHYLLWISAAASALLVALMATAAWLM